MKRHITNKAITRVAYEFVNADDIIDKTGDPAKYDCWIGKKLAIADTFAIMAGITLVEACVILRSEYAKRKENL